MADDERLGPAFDSNILSRPTQRKFVGCWMDRAGLDTLVLPQVWRELTATPSGMSPTASVRAWFRMEEISEAPFRWASLDATQAEEAAEVRRLFTQVCFPRSAPDEITTNSDAIIISEGVVLNTDVLVTGDFRSIDHYEVNDVLAKGLGRNSRFVVTLDDALMEAYSGGELGEEMLATALACVSPNNVDTWSVDDAFSALDGLRKVLVGANMPRMSERLLNRWECSRDLAGLVARALMMAGKSKALRYERLRAEWHVEYGRLPPNMRPNAQQGGLEEPKRPCQQPLRPRPS